MSSSETSSMPEPKNDVQTRAVAQGIRLDALPQHIACIMDGNGRWATARGEHRLVGHQQGYLTLKDVLTTADELGIRYLTVYGFSAENWRRPGEEVNGLMDLIAAAASAELTGLIKNNVRVRISGRLDELPQSTRDNLRALEAET
ncbi:MAG: polyprenyl diphosphate synthase, partial [Armatimonadota bacterium]